MANVASRKVAYASPVSVTGLTSDLDVPSLTLPPPWTKLSRAHTLAFASLLIAPLASLMLLAALPLASALWAIGVHVPWGVLCAGFFVRAATPSNLSPSRGGHAAPS